MRKMFELTQVGIIPKLIANYDSPFPNASYLCLSIFAFYASWLRINFCKDNILQLSQVLLDRLSEWSRRTDVQEEERELAKRLHEDFSRFGPAVAQNTPGSGASSSTSGKNKQEHEMEEEGDYLMYQVKEDRTIVNHVEEKSQAEVWKEKGNAAYKVKDLSLAIECYSKAMDVPVTQEQLLTEGPRRAIFHSNRAAAYLARARAGLGLASSNDYEYVSSDAMGHLEGADLVNSSPEERSKLNYKAALMDCDQALDLESGNVKARYRKAQALRGLERYSEAIDSAITALNVAPKSLEKEIKAFLDKLKDLKESGKKAEEEKKLSKVKLADSPEPKSKVAADSSENILESILGGG